MRIHEIYGVKGVFKRNDDIGEWSTDEGLRFFQVSCNTSIYQKKTWSFLVKKFLAV